MIIRRFCSRAILSDLTVPPPNPQRLLRAAVLGLPNAGKSTLVNQLVGRNVAGVSPKPHTTRSQALGVFTEGDHQVVLIDTPGVVSLQYGRKMKFSKPFVTGPKRSTDEADLMLVMIDASDRYTRFKLNEQLLKIMKEVNLPTSLVINKVDLLGYKQLLLKIVDSINSQSTAHPFNEVFMISALTGDGVDKLKDYLLDNTKPCDWLYDVHTYSNQSLEDQLAEVVREKLFKHLHKEIPYSIKQRLVICEERDDVLYIHKKLTCTKSSQVSIVVGSGGKTVKAIADEAQSHMESLLSRPVQLILSVNHSNK
ncbi:PREDICTED: GTPase Era, mitochondrial-like [Amphimedon queenslandica]|uniref:GTPase Era, mitochondrial n=1 Tax=Amphimedon queenslandica TaxID=400682 RepID=A0A1X7UGB7_AMPQE|nr:PREDICTED: GTPase Era, mitochondrial-like [Amphimedon queenslandica]|eukprot:XP_003387981.1 PREDICTED: GTPase Era, mitochondrial-like [Amphimedon queenslandica]